MAALVLGKLLSAEVVVEASGGISVPCSGVIGGHAAAAAAAHSAQLAARQHSANVRRAALVGRLALQSCVTCSLIVLPGLVTSCHKQ